MAGLAPVELNADCTACGLEAGVVEVYDALVPACRFGVPASTRCKLCAVASTGHFDRPIAKPLVEIPANRCPACLLELTPAALDARACPSCAARASLYETNAPSSFTAVADLERALDAWAERERFASRDALVRATFVEPDVAKIFDALQRREPLEILADPFANMGMRTRTGESSRRKDASAKSTAPETPQAKAAAPARAVSSVEAAARPISPAAPRVAAVAALPTAEDIALAPTEPLPPLAPREPPPLPPLASPEPPPLAPLASPEPPPRSAPPRAIVYPLVSVIVADGEIHPEELALVDRFLQSEGLAPLAPHELCVHHPSEVAHFVPKERREDVVRLMCESAAVDGMPDESERRVIRAYATAWDVDDEKLEFWMWGYETMNTSLARQLFLKLRRFVLSARWGEAS